MTENTSISNESIYNLEEDDLQQVDPSVRLMHQIFSITISIVGTVLNLLTIVMIVKSRLYKQTAVVFILNLIIHNLLISSLCLPSVAYESFHGQHFQVEIHCRVMGYIIYSILGSDMLGVLLISINRYFLIVRFRLYHKIYTVRNIKIIFVLSWIFTPFLFVFPLTETWGAFKYDYQRFICHPLSSSASFTVFLIVVIIIIFVPTLVYCYARILYTVVSNRRKINAKRSIHNDDKPRKNDAQLVVTVIVLLTAFAIVYLPFFILAVLDPQMSKYEIKVHVVFVYVAWSHCLVNALVYTMTSRQIKQAYKELLGCHSNENSMTDISTMPDFKLEVKVHIKKTISSNIMFLSNSQSREKILDSLPDEQ